MKKVLALALTLVMVFGMFAVASFAADEEIIVKATATAGKTGETITLKVETTQVNTPYGGFDVIVQYDPAVVKPVLTNEDLEADRDLYNSIIALIDVPFKNVDINLDYGSTGNQIKVLGADGSITQNAASQLISLEFNVLADFDAENIPFTFAQTTFLNSEAQELTVASSVDVQFADTAALAEAIAKAGEVDTKLYTEESVAALTAAVKAGEALVAEVNPAKQGDIDAAAAAILAAIEALQTPAEKELADAKAALQTVIDTAKKFDTAGFSKEQLAALEAAISDAEEALASDDVAVVTAAKTALEAALAVTPENPDTSDTNVVVFAVLATISLVAAGFVVAKKRKA